MNKDSKIWCSKEIDGLVHYVYVDIESSKILCLQHGWTIKVDPPDKVTRK